MVMNDAESPEFRVIERVLAYVYENVRSLVGWRLALMGFVENSQACSPSRFARFSLRID